MGVGVALLVGFYTRIAILLVLIIMAVATYVHLVVHDPALFPLQPAEGRVFFDSWPFSRYEFHYDD